MPLVHARALRLCGIALVLALASCRHAPPAPTTTTPPAPPGSFHVVAAGETLSDIARNSGVSVDEIVEVNGLSSADDVVVGETLFIPSSTRAPRRKPPATPTTTPPASVLHWPTDGVVLRDFSSDAKKPFDGLLIAAPAGTAVHAARAGTVGFVGDQGPPLGRTIIVQHDDGLITVYAHLDTIVVKSGAAVVDGQVLGAVGTSGRQESPRLFFQVRRGRVLINPLSLLPAD